MKNFALITGASSGIGLSYAEIFAKDGINLVLVARSEDKLKQIQKDLETNYKIQVFILIKDLSSPTSTQEIYDFTTLKNLRIDYLINNAGVGDLGDFSESDPERILQMIDLNIRALTSLTRYYVTDMKKNRFGKVLNVSSTASFQPGPYMAVYFATKAYVTNFSLAIAVELEPHGITVTNLCPGPTESNFASAANASNSSIFLGNHPNSTTVAKFGYDKMNCGRRIAIHGWGNLIKVWSVKFLPTNLTLAMMKYILKR